MVPYLEVSLRVCSRQPHRHPASRCRPVHYTEASRSRLRCRSGFSQTCLHHPPMEPLSSLVTVSVPVLLLQVFLLQPSAWFRVRQLFLAHAFLLIAIFPLAGVGSRVFVILRSVIFVCLRFLVSNSWQPAAWPCVLPQCCNRLQIIWQLLVSSKPPPRSPHASASSLRSEVTRTDQEVAPAAFESHDHRSLHQSEECFP